MSDQHPKLYRELASWWPIFSDRSDYEEEASIFKKLIKTNCPEAQSLLELGSGGGNNASHLKADFTMTLVDLSPEMIQESEKVNPECDHVVADMRTVRLDRTFDAVFIHDAIMYMRTRKDLELAITTAHIHCKSNGCALIVPDAFTDTFTSKTSHGGHDKNGRSMRYLEWDYDADPGDSVFATDFAYLLRDVDGTVRCEYDRHEMGLFSRGTWLEMMKEIGFQAKIVPLQHSELESGTYSAVVGIKK